MILLDTNLVSAFLKRDASTQTPQLFQFVSEQLTDGFAISYVTLFELRRGLEFLVEQGQPRRKLVDFEKFIERVAVLGLDSGMGDGWNLASRLWAQGRAYRPARVFSDADLLIAATAAFHRLEFASCDTGLIEGLQAIGFPSALRLVRME